MATSGSGAVPRLWFAHEFRVIYQEHAMKQPKPINLERENEDDIENTTTPTSPGQLPASVQAAEPVTVDTFVRAETDRTMAAYVDQGGFGKFFHIRQPTPIDKQDVIRMNRDTLYSIGVFDLTNPVTITLPDSDGRYLSALIINQDHSMLPMEYAPAEIVLTKDLIGTRYVVLILRTFINATDTADIKAANALQDAVTVAQDDPGAFEVPDWDIEQVEMLRKAINVLAATHLAGAETRRKQPSISTSRQRRTTVKRRTR
jgi:hypothetical protein